MHVFVVTRPFLHCILQKKCSNRFSLMGQKWIIIYIIYVTYCLLYIYYIYMRVCISYIHILAFLRGEKAISFRKIILRTISRRNSS